MIKIKRLNWGGKLDKKGVKAEKKDLETVTIKMNLQENHIKIKNDEEKSIKKPILSQKNKKSVESDNK